MQYKALYLPPQVQKLLGKGSYGIVYRVKRLSDGGVYALKEADVRKMSPLERADAVNEIRLLASVKHPNVVRYHEAFLDGKAGPQSAHNSYETCYTCWDFPLIRWLLLVLTLSAHHWRLRFSIFTAH